MAVPDPIMEGASAAAASGRQNPRPWLRAALALGLATLPFLLFWPATSALVSIWADTATRTYTHGWLIAVISVWLLVRDRVRYALVPMEVSWAACFALVAMGLAWLVAYRAGIQLFFISLLPLMSLAALTACFGWQFLRRSWLALAYLFFAVPVWGLINPLLQWSSVFAVRVLLRLIGIPVHFVENTVQIPAGTFEIADACSGLHYFIVALAIAVLYGEVHRDSLRTRALLAALAAGLAVLSNWVRIVVIVIAGHVTDMQHPLVGPAHYTFGWYVFAAAMLAFFLLARLLPLGTADAAVLPVQESGHARALPLRGACAAVLALSLAPVWSLVGWSGVVGRAGGPLLPQHLAAWSGPHETTSDWTPVFVGADAEARGTYRQAGGELELYSAVYFEQRQGKELVGYDNSLLGHGWHRIGTATAALAPWSELEARDGRGGHWLFWYAYRIEDRWYAGGTSFQLTYGLKALIGAPVASVQIARAECSAGCESARARLRDFVADAWTGT